MGVRASSSHSDGGSRRGHSANPLLIICDASGLRSGGFDDTSAIFGPESADGRRFFETPSVPSEPPGSAFGGFGSAIGSAFGEFGDLFGDLLGGFRSGGPPSSPMSRATSSLERHLSPVGDMYRA